MPMMIESSFSSKCSSTFDVCKKAHDEMQKASNVGNFAKCIDTCGDCEKACQGVTGNNNPKHCQDYSGLCVSICKKDIASCFKYELEGAKKELNQ